MQPRCARIGLTGGIGSGKSTVAALFHALGVPVLDLDAVGRELTRRGQPGLMRLRQAFGDWIVDSGGDLDRSGLADYCFASDERTRQLNRIMHPLIWQAAEEWLARQRAIYVLIEASVLLESKAAARMDAIIVVLADLERRRQRLVTCAGLSASRFADIVARQCSDDERRQQADYIIDNNGSIDGLRQQVEKLHRQLVQRFARPGKRLDSRHGSV